MHYYPVVPLPGGVRGGFFRRGDWGQAKAPPINNMYKYARTCCGTVVHFLRFRESGKIVIWNSGTQERLGWSLPTRSTVNTMAAKTSKGHKSSPLGNSSFRPLFLSS